MTGRGAIIWCVIAGCILLALLQFLPVPGIMDSPDGGPPVVYLLYTSAGSMSQLLNTGQIQAFIIWEPVVSNAELAGIGRRVAVPADLPPPGKWADAASCVLVLRRDVIWQYPEISALLSALTTAAINRTREDPALAEKITADWVYGSNPILTPRRSISPLDVEHHAFHNIEFTASAQPPVSGAVSHVLNQGTGGWYDPSRMMMPAIRERGEQFLNGSAVPQTGGEIPTIKIGYLPSSDNFAPLYVMVRNSSYFCDRYGFCLVPDDPDAERPVRCTLLVRGEPAAHVSLVPGQSGGGIMTTIGQQALEGAYVGAVPAELQIALDNPSYIIQSINTGGTGLVTDPRAPCQDWTGFVGWVKNSSDRNDPVVIATVQSSIQEDMIREAFAHENISVRLYGTDFETTYP